MKEKRSLKQEGYRKLLAHYIEKTVQNTLNDLFPEVELQVGTFNLIYSDIQPNIALITARIQEKMKITKTKGKMTIKLKP